MSSPRYRPRDFCVDPGAFGKARNIDWLKPAQAQLHFLAASKIQHAFAWRIRLALKESALPAKTYAIRSGTSYDRLMKMLRGETIMRLEDLGQAEALLDMSVLTSTTPRRQG